jgi:gliding motility-associated-like protein
LGISSCRIASNILLADIYPKPAISAGPDRTKFAGRPVQLLGSSDGAANNQFEWAPPLYLSDATIAVPLADPPQLQSYVLKVTNSRGCISRDTVSVNVIDKLYVPTAFTPNGDGKNDRWNIPNLDLADGALVQVFDRAGQVVFNAANSSASWDGNYQGLPLPTGVYIYLIRFRDGFIMKGQLTLIRK